MKSLQKRKANGSALQWTLVRSHLDESPFEQEGKYWRFVGPNMLKNPQ